MLAEWERSESRVSNVLNEDLLRILMDRRRFVGGVVAGMLASGLLAACGGDDDDDDDDDGGSVDPTATSDSGSEEPTATTAAAVPPTATATLAADETPTPLPTLAETTDLELIVGHHLDPTELNPFNTTAAFQSVWAQIIEQFVIFDPESVGVSPWLAESFEWIDDLTLELKLRDGISFTNGEPLDAEAARFSIDELAAAPQYGIFLPSDVYKETTIVDDLTVQVHINRPYSPFLGALARGGVALPPVYYQEKGGQEGFGQEPIGTGPFFLEEWVKDDHITLVRNEDYWRGAHPIGKVTYRVIPEDTARIAALETGEIHIALNVPVSAMGRIEDTSDADLILQPGLRKFAMHFDTINVDDPAISNPMVRTAMNHAIDKQAIVDSLYQGAATVLEGQWLVSSEFGFNPDVPRYEYDPDLARDLLAEAGFPDGFDFQLSYTVGRYPLDKEMGEIVAGYLEQVGINVSQQALEYGTFTEIRNAGTLGSHQWGLLLPPDPHFNYMLFTTGSIFENHDLGPRYTELVDEGATETDLARREEIYHEIAELVHADPPMVFLIVPSDLYGVSTKVQGFTPRTDQVLWLFDVTLSE